MKRSNTTMLAWALALISLIVLPVSTVLIVANKAGWDARVWEYLSGAIVGLGAPVLGLVILRKQPHNRIGWLWLVIGLAIAFTSLAQGLKFFENTTRVDGRSSLVFAMMLFSETAYIVRFICMVLMMFWFPDGYPTSTRWRILPLWAVLSFLFLLIPNFAQEVPWSDVEGMLPTLPLIDNPIGFIPVKFSPIYDGLAVVGFLSIVVMSVLAVLVMLSRYRSAGPQVQAQIRWFTAGGILYAANFFVAIFLLSYMSFVPGIMTVLAILPFYLAIGFAITRYRLYDIDLIIRKTLQYTLLTAILALVYFGSITLLQSISTAAFGLQSPVMVVMSTLAIAALFNPLRIRIQAFIDRRFFRRKYDAERVLAQFAAIARDKVDIDQLTTALHNVIEEVVQPDTTSLWLKK